MRTDPSSQRQVPATAPSTMNVGTDCGIFVLKTLGRFSSGSTRVRPQRRLLIRRVGVL